MDIIYAIGVLFLSTSPPPNILTHRAEDVPKGRNDRPLEDVVIYDSGEVRPSSQNCYYLLTGFPQLPVEPVVDEQGTEVPLRAEL